MDDASTRLTRTKFLLLPGEKAGMRADIFLKQIRWSYAPRVANAQHRSFDTTRMDLEREVEQCPPRANDLERASPARQGERQ